MQRSAIRDERRHNSPHSAGLHAGDAPENFFTDFSSGHARFLDGDGLNVHASLNPSVRSSQPAEERLAIFGIDNPFTNLGQALEIGDGVQ